MKNSKQVSFLNKAMQLCDCMMDFTGCELYHYNTRGLLIGMKQVITTLDDVPDDEVSGIKFNIGMLLEKERIAEAKLNGIDLSDECWPEDCIDPLEWDAMVVPVTSKMGDGFSPNDIEYKIAEKLDWLDMTVEVALPAISTIMRHYPKDDKEAILDFTPTQIFALLMNGDVTAEEWDMFTSLRGEIERDMRSGMSYQESIDEEWFK